MKKTFYIDNETWELLEKQKNKSSYICNLVKKDNKYNNNISIDELLNLLDKLITEKFCNKEV